MWFKQIQLWQLTAPFKHASEDILARLENFAFKPCMPSMPSSTGWVAPIGGEEDAPLMRGINGCIMLCLQIEEKILPGTVIAHALKERIKKVEAQEARKVRKKEKLSFKDEVTQSLLTRAFTKLTQVYAYIDTHNQWLVLNTTSASRSELFITMFKKAFGDEIESFEVTKPSAILTHWLKTKDYPKEFAIEKACMLQDPNQQTRVIRAQEQDLFSSSIQTLVKEGCEAVQMALCWHDRLQFALAEDFSIKGLRLAEEDITEIKEAADSKEQKFDADLLMMSDMLTGLIKDLLSVFQRTNDSARAA